MISSRNIFALAIVNSLAFLTQAVFAKTFRVDTTSSEVEFLAIGKPGFLRVNGKNGKVSGEAGETSGGKFGGTFVTKLDDFKTGIDLRDEHMKKKYLETDKHPDAVLTIEPFSLDTSTNKEVDFKGKLSLHGVDQPVTGTAKLMVKDSGHIVVVDAAFPIKLSDFKIDIPRYSGITVAEDVNVKAHFSAFLGADSATSSKAQP